MPIKTLTDLVAVLQKDGSFNALSSSVKLQFGDKQMPLLGAELLPEQLRRDNQYTEYGIRYQSLIANAGSDYSPAQLNPGGQLTGTFDVKLGRNDQADTLSVQAYETIMALLELSSDSTNRRDMGAIASLLDWYDQFIMQPVIRLAEKYRWDAIVDAQCLRTGSNGYREVVLFPNPVGQRVIVPSGTVAAPTGWFSATNNYDPLSDLLGIQRTAAAKGFTLDRIISNYEAAYLFMNHPGTRARFMGVSLAPGTNQFTSTISGVSADDVNAMLNKNGLPKWETYDRTYNYRDTTGAIAVARYLDRPTYHPIIITCKTERSQDIDLGANKPILMHNTLGYYGIGRMPGRPNSGRISNQKMVSDQYPETLYAECLEMGLPVITMPEALFVLKVMKPTP